MPAFRIFSDRTLRALATSRPGTSEELLAVPGIGISTVEKYGMEIYRACARTAVEGPSLKLQTARLRWPGGPVGRTAEGATGALLQAEILTYSRSRGAFAGCHSKAR